MKAAVLREVNRPLEVEEVQIDNPGLREVLVHTRTSGVCHSDLLYVEGKTAYQSPPSWATKRLALWKQWVTR